MSRVAVVTGAASGMGLAVARRFGAAGHKVGLLDLDADGVATAAEELRDSGTTALGLPVDVSDRAAVDGAVEQVRRELGPVEILVTSAGIDVFEPILNVTPESWDRVIAVNLTGTFSCIQEAVKDMLPAKWGRIVTISSQSAQSGAPNMTHYSASKGGVISLTRSLSVELARSGIVSNTIAPSIVDTPMSRHATETGDFPGIDVIAPMIPLGRAATPADIAAGVRFLVAEDVYTTGQILAVNGGMYI